MDEDGIIQTYFAPLAAGAEGAFDLTDDAAAIACPNGAELVVTTDALISGIHFLPDDPPADIAAKALGVNLSDLAGKGAEPLAYTLSLSLPDPVSETWLAGFRDGLAAVQDAHGIHLVGGDTTRSPDATMLSITAFGTVPAGRMVRRSTARPGDLLYVTGTIGDAALGLLLVTEDPRGTRWNLDPEAHAFLVSRYRRPAPRTGMASALRGHVSAALDVSDGLLIDTVRLCHASNVTATIRADKVPLSRAARSCLAADPDALETILTGGDDYELLLAVPAEKAEAFARAAGAAGTSLHHIGELAGPASSLPPVTVLDPDGTPLHFHRPGYTHFA
ncbi:MAG: thiamine-phosphate kinase [Dichotomicrobium sp.]